jgi:quinol monooxygenase YgiN
VEHTTKMVAVGSRYIPQTFCAKEINCVTPMGDRGEGWVHPVTKDLNRRDDSILELTRFVELARKADPAVFWVVFWAGPIRSHLRNRLHGVDTEISIPEENTMTTTTAVTKEVTTLINVLTVEPEHQQKLINLLRESTECVVSKLDGWISTRFIAAKDERHVVIYSQWRDLASVEAMQSNPEMIAYFPRVAALAAFYSFAGHVVYDHHA